MKEIVILSGYAAPTRIPRLSVTLPSDLLKTFLNNVTVTDEPFLTKKLKKKFWNLEDCFVKTFPELQRFKTTISIMTEKAKLTPIKSEEWNDISKQYTERFLQRFLEMIDWCRDNDKWALKSASHISSPQAIKNYLAYVAAPHGGLPTTHTREEQIEELRKLEDKETISELFKQ